MTRNTNQTQLVVWNVLKIIGKLSIFVLQAIVILVSDDTKKTRLTAGKAQQLYEDGAISGVEFAKHIHGE